MKEASLIKNYRVQENYSYNYFNLLFVKLEKNYKHILVDSFLGAHFQKLAKTTKDDM